MKAVKIIAVLLLTVIVGAIGALSMVDLNSYKGLIVEKAMEATGRKLEIAGEIKFKISLRPSLIIKDVSFENAEWGSKENLLSVSHVEAGLDIPSLLQGVINVAKIKLVKPEISLEINKNGEKNWDLSKPEKAEEDTTEKTGKVEQTEESSTEPMEIAVENLLIEDALFLYEDAVKNEKHELKIKIAKISKNEDDRLDIEIETAANNQKIEVSGTVDTVKKLITLDEDKIYSFDVAVKALETELSLKGGVKTSPLFFEKVAVEFKAKNLLKVSEFSGSALPELGAYKIAMDVWGNPEKEIRVEHIKASAGKTSLNGDVLLTMDKKVPYLKADFKIPLFDATVLNSSEETAEEGTETKEKTENVPTKTASKNEKLFSDEKIDVKGMKSVNADISLEVDKIQLKNNISVDNIIVAVALKDGSLKVAPLSAKAGGGNLSGAVSLVAGSMLDVSFAGKDVFMEKLLPAFYDKDKIVGGKTNLNIDVKGKGNSMHKLMAGLNGSLLFTLDDMKLVSEQGGINDFMKTIGRPDSKEKSTAIKCTVANLKVKNGQIVSDRQIAAETDMLNMVVNGNINLDEEKLELALKPSANGKVKVSMASLASMVKIKGPLSSPGISADAAGVAKTAATIGAAVATGGLSLLGQTLLSSFTEDDSPCQTALHGYKNKKSSEQKKEPITKKIIKTPEKAVKKIGNDIKNLGDGLGKSLKGLFGGGR